MSLEQIKKVVDAEESGDAAISRASSDAKKLAADAETAGKRVYEQAIAAANEKARQLFEKATEKGNTEAAKIAEKAKGDCDLLVKAAEPKMDGVASMILGRIVNS
jgi:vacuolar-type H+-ATPase subunit H